MMGKGRGVEWGDRVMDRERGDDGEDGDKTMYRGRRRER